jgi:hypothetical protein
MSATVPAGLIGIEVACSAAPGEVELQTVQVLPGTTVGDAVRASGVLERHPRLAQELVLGIWGRRVSEATVLREGDRVEIYRPLTVDPKEARRLRYRGQPKAGRKRPLTR